MRGEEEHLRTAASVWIVFGASLKPTLDSRGPHFFRTSRLSEFDFFFFFLPPFQHLNGSSDNDFLAPAPVDVQLFPGCSISSDHERELWERTGPRHPPALVGPLLGRPGSGHALPAHVQTVREIQQREAPQGGKHRQEFQSQPRCVNTHSARN